MAVSLPLPRALVLALDEAREELDVWGEEVEETEARLREVVGEPALDLVLEALAWALRVAVAVGEAAPSGEAVGAVGDCVPPPAASMTVGDTVEEGAAGVAVDARWGVEEVDTVKRAGEGVLKRVEGGVGDTKGEKVDSGVGSEVGVVDAEAVSKWGVEVVEGVERK